MGPLLKETLKFVSSVAERSISLQRSRGTIEANSQQKASCATSEQKAFCNWIEVNPQN
jgi:hypothetical protein